MPKRTAKHQHRWYVIHAVWQGDRLVRYCLCGAAQSAKATRWGPIPRGDADMRAAVKRALANAEALW